jgi:hypothetical protein
MHRDPPCPQVVDPQHTAYDISSEVIEDQDFPYWIPILVENRGRRNSNGALILAIGGLFRFVVQIQHALNGPCKETNISAEGKPRVHSRLLLI